MTVAQPTYVNEKANRDLSMIPGSNGLPFIGQTFDFIDDNLGMTLANYKKYGPVFRMSLVFQNIVNTVGPEFLRQVSLDQDKVFSSQAGWEGMVGEFFQGSLIVQDFEKHRMQRRLMQTAFKAESLHGYIHSINNIVQASLKQWPKQEPMLFYPAVKRLLLDIAAKVFLGAQLEEQNERINGAFVDFANGATSIVKKNWPGFAYHKGLKGRQVLDNFIRQRIDEKRQGDGTDMFSHFCREKSDTGDYYSHQEITDHVLFLLFAAHDTTTSALTMAMQLLAAHQDWQTELRDTIGRIETDIPTFDQLGRNIPLLDYTFKEVLRLYPPVPGLIRRTIKPCEIGGYEVPAHTMVGTSISANHHLPEYWHEPFKFDPMRFSESRAEHKQHKFLWAPFGGGGHKCIGLHFADMLFKCVLLNLLKTHRVQFADSRQASGKILYVPFTRPKDNLPLVLISER
ncbi:MAG: cytochrome P450 [Pseudomonadales bacterium]|nr:cytochrome P450 [Pseudomonadales bacterium]